MGKPAEKRLKGVPKFRDEAQERAFWEASVRDSTEHLDWSQATRAVFPNLKPSTKTISLRLPRHLLEGIKAAANSRDVPYQSLIKVWLQEKLLQPASTPAASTTLASSPGTSRTRRGTR
jgi:predicted DNA binding CopG/RHH family protein